MKIKEFVGGTLIGGGMTGIFLLIKHLGLTHRLILHGGEVPGYFIILLVAIYVALTIHEPGHLTAARIMHFKLYLFVSGPFGFRRKENDRIGFFSINILRLQAGSSSYLPL